MRIDWHDLSGDTKELLRTNNPEWWADTGLKGNDDCQREAEKAGWIITPAGSHFETSEAK